MSSSYITFGDYLRQRRKRLDLTQEEVAQRAQCAAETVRKLEAGSRRASKEVALHLADALGLTGEERVEFLRLARGIVEDVPASVPVASPSAVPLLATKLFVPRPRGQLVARSRLMARLEAGQRRALTLVAAPAGFGKSTILAEWLSHTQPPRTVAWLALDASDSEPIHFLRYLITALQNLVPAIGATLLPLLQSPQPPPLEPMLPVLLNDLTCAPDDSVLILDDYHVVDAPGIHQMLTFLLDHLPPQLHVIIASRVDPPLPLARLRARGQLIEIRAADLRFTTEEAADFLHDVMGLQLSPADIAAVEARTEGWIAGLQLAALSLQEVPAEQVSAFIASFTGSHRFVVDYLVDEVLANQPPDVQRFLLQTSILDRLCGPLCDAVTEESSGTGQRLLEQLERANLFLVPLDEERRWYRYHHLFAQVLNERLVNSGIADSVAALHRRAAAWSEQQNLLVDAVKHALVAQDWEGAARLIEPQGRLLIVRGQVHVVANWLNALPPAFIASRPYLLDLQAVVYFCANDLEAAERTILTAEAALKSSHATNAEARTMLGYASLLRANIARARGDVRLGTELSQVALDNLSHLDQVRRVTAMLGVSQRFMVDGGVGAAQQRAVTEVVSLARAVGNLLTTFNSTINLAEFQRRQGHLHLAAATLEEARNVAPDLLALQTLPNGASYFCIRGFLLWEWNEVDEAEATLLQGREMIRRGRQTHGDFVAMGYLALAHLQAQRDQDEAARATLRELQEIAVARNFAPYLVTRVQATTAELALCRGELAHAVQWADAGTLPLDGSLDYLREPEYLTLALVRIVQARVEHELSRAVDAVALLDQWLVHAEAGARHDSAIRILTLRALAKDAQGEVTAAQRDLTRALELAAPEGYVRLFLDEGAALAPLLEEILRTGLDMPLARNAAESLLATIVAASRASRGDNAPSISSFDLGAEHLTPREVEVLRLLAAGNSNQAIAQALVVEIGTVKRHVSNIMDKLHASSRLDAVARARALNLLS